MTAFTVTTAQNIDALTSKAGGDTYAINGGTLTIDQDSRYGLNQTTSTSLGSITVSDTLGGTVEIDARAVRLIPYNTGSGNVPADGATISQGAVTGKLIGVWSAINVAPTAAGAAMPASGFIKVKQVNTLGGYAAGALTGIGASATGADVAGWIEVVGDENATATVPRLGTFRTRGEWFEVGATTGTNTDTYQLPTSGSTHYFPGVWVETGVASGVFEFYPCAGSLVATASVATDAVRGKVCWISTAGVLRLGHDGTNANTGYVPPSGLKIRIGNILLVNCTTAARTANAVPNATMGTRYDFTTTAGGYISMDKTCAAWYLGFTGAYSVDLSYVGTLDQIYLYNMLSPITWLNSGVGQSANLTQVTLNIGSCSSGGTITNCVFGRANQDSNWDVCDIADAIGFTFSSVRVFSFRSRTNQSAYSMLLSRCIGFVFTDLTFGMTSLRLASCSTMRFTNTIYFDDIKSTTLATNLMAAISLGSGVFDAVFDGFSYGGLTNCHSAYWQFYVSDAFCRNILIKNIGSSASPLSMGSVNIARGLAFIGYNSSNVKFSRTYTEGGSQGGFGTGDATNNGLTLENVRVGYSTAPAIACKNAIVKGMLSADFSVSGTGCTGSIFGDNFFSTTAGRIRIYTNEPSAINSAYVTLGNGAKFTGGTNGLYMPTIGMSATWETPHYIIGHTSLVSLTVAGGANYSQEFAIDKNDGGGFSAWASATPGNLSGVTGIDAAKGFKLRLRLITTTTNSNALSSIYFLTVSTPTAQSYQYPLDVATVSVSGLATGSMVKATKVSDGSLLFAGAESAGSISFVTEYAGAIAIEARKASASPYYRPWVSQMTTVLGATISTTAVQQLDE